MNRLPKLFGYAAVWGAIAQTPKGNQRFACGAFGKATNFRDVRALWDHNYELVLAFGRTESGAGRLTLREDGRGLAFELEPFEDRRWIDSAMADIRVGKVRGMSIGYEILEGYSEKLASGMVVFTITRAYLDEISPVDQPAFRETSLHLIEPAANVQPAEPAAAPASRIIRIDPALVSNPRRRNLRVGLTMNC
jgi:HK97 family phage prohead protease